MTYRRPGRLYRALASAGLTTRPILEVTTDRTGTIADDEIRSVTIRRGKSSAGGGADPAIATVALASSAGLQTGGDVSIRLGTPFAEALAARIGQTAARLAPRFAGRFGPMRTHDDGRTLWDEFDASSWITQASTSSWTVDLTAGMTLPAAMLALLKSPGELTDKLTITYPGILWDNLHEAIPDATYANTAAKLTRNIGVLLRPWRDGTAQLVNMPYRRDRALSGLTGSVALGRRHALAPITWEQPTDAPGDVYRVRWTDENGDPRLYVADAGATGPYDGRIQELDWQYVRFYSEQWQHMYAMRAQSLTTRFSIPTLSFDMIHLITSSNLWDRRVAALLLVLESGDHVYLGGDWPGTFSGIYFAEGIEETISGNEWRITLQLVPFGHVTGTIPPAIPATYWDQATGQWDDHTKTWETFT